MNSYVTGGVLTGLLIGSWISEFVFNRLAFGLTKQVITSTDFSKTGSFNQVMTQGQNQIDYLTVMYFISILIFGIIGGFAGHYIGKRLKKSKK